MKKLCVIALLFCVMSFGSIQEAHAGKFMFGKQQDIKKIEDVALQGPRGEDLYLGYMTETQFFGLGVYMKDAGYILGVKGEYGAFYPMLDDERLAQAQEAGVLPKPLPEYKIDTFDWVFGFSLWVVLIIMGAWAGIKHLFASRKGQTA